MSKRKASVCVYCGSRMGAKPAYEAAAKEAGTLIAKRGWQLVYGAGDVGLMGTVARAAQAAGGDTFGVIPVHLMKWEVGKTDLTSFVVSAVASSAVSGVGPKATGTRSWLSCATSSLRALPMRRFWTS